MTNDLVHDDPFRDGIIIKGLDHLGRAIVDASGVPSGSPANYEALRGATHPSGLPVAAQAVADVESIIARLRQEFPES